MDTRVYLVGAGPGDPGLITEKGKNILMNADVVIYDSLVNPLLLKNCKKGAHVICVGKRKGKKSFEQEEINDLLIQYARKDLVVARLKGGDPFIFGRGGEEAAALCKNDIRFEIVPGVSSVYSVPAYSGVPLTHRHFNASFTVVTGHREPGKDLSGLDWQSLSKMETLVFLMSLHNTHTIMNKLLEHGIPPDTPVLITSNGTEPSQRSITGTVSDISAKLENNPLIKTPAVTLVGNVVNLRKELIWFEKKPLFGKKILITRASAQSADLAGMLYKLGAYIYELPVIEIKDPTSWKKADRSIMQIAKYDYIIFTSVNGVRKFMSRVFECGRDSRIFGGKKIITIGTKTAESLGRFGIVADIIPQNYVAEGIIDTLSKREIRNKNILIPRASVAREFLPEKLREMGAKVDIVECYRTQKPRHRKKDIEKIRRYLMSGDIDIVTFTSSSTVDNFFEIFGSDSKITAGFICASIGPVTSSRIEKWFHKPQITSDVYTTRGLVMSIVRHFQKLS